MSNTPTMALMTGFTNVTRNEPDNSFSDATTMLLQNGEEIGYLYTGDIDFYRLRGQSPFSSFQPFKGSKPF